MSNNDNTFPFLASKGDDTTSDSTSGRRRRSRNDNAAASDDEDGQHQNESGQGSLQQTTRHRLPPMDEVNLMDLLAAAAENQRAILATPQDGSNQNQQHQQQRQQPAPDARGGFVFGRGELPQPLFPYRRDDEGRATGSLLEPLSLAGQGGYRPAAGADDGGNFPNDFSQYLDQQLGMLPLEQEEEEEARNRAPSRQSSSPSRPRGQEDGGNEPRCRGRGGRRRQRRRLHDDDTNMNSNNSSGLPSSDEENQ